MVELRDSELSGTFRVDLDEISGLALRIDRDGRVEVLAVGDHDFVVITATLARGVLHDQHAEDVGALIDELTADPDSSSEWEAIAADYAGRVFLVREDSASVVVLGPGLERHVHTIELCEAGPDERAAQLLNDGNAGPEAILLLRNGHVLVAKQRDPVLLIEFGPERDQEALGSGSAPISRRTRSSSWMTERAAASSRCGPGSFGRRTRRRSGASTTSPPTPRAGWTRSRRCPDASTSSTRGGRRSNSRLNRGGGCRRRSSPAKIESRRVSPSIPRTGPWSRSTPRETTRTFFLLERLER